MKKLLVTRTALLVWAVMVQPFSLAQQGSLDPKPSAAKQPAGAKQVAPQAARYPAHITAYDIMTAEDEFYYHHLSKLCQGGDIADWHLVRTLATLGADYVDANALARAANLQINISEQPRARAISQMVNECADILGIEPPPTYIEGNPFPNSYVTGLGHPHLLVLTSGLVELYSETPDELRFVIGHELGHIKAQHLRTLLVGRIIFYTLFGAITGGSEDPGLTAFAKTAINVVTFGTLMHWYRAAEYSADRAGLICVGGKVNVAQQALSRLLHQTRQSNPLMDETKPGFDVAQLKRDQQSLRHRPLVELYSLLYQFGASHPFIPDRSVEIGNWSKSDEYANLMSRPAKQDLRLEVTSIKVDNIPETDLYVPVVDSGATDPVVRVTYGGKEFSTRRESDRKNVVWDQQNFRFDHVDGAGIIVDLYDYNTVLPIKFVASGRLPVDNNKPGEYSVTGKLSMDIEAESTQVELPVVTLQYRIERVGGAEVSSERAVE